MSSHDTPSTEAANGRCQILTPPIVEDPGELCIGATAWKTRSNFPWSTISRRPVVSWDCAPAPVYWYTSSCWVHFVYSRVCRHLGRFKCPANRLLAYLSSCISSVAHKGSENPCTSGLWRGHQDSLVECRNSWQYSAYWSHWSHQYRFVQRGFLNYSRHLMRFILQ